MSLDDEKTDGAYSDGQDSILGSHSDGEDSILGGRPLYTEDPSDGEQSDGMSDDSVAKAKVLEDAIQGLQRQLASIKRNAKDKYHKRSVGAPLSVSNTKSSLGSGQSNTQVVVSAQSKRSAGITWTDVVRITDGRHWAELAKDLPDQSFTVDSLDTHVNGLEYRSEVLDKSSGEDGDEWESTPSEADGVLSSQKRSKEDIRLALSGLQKPTGDSNVIYDWHFSAYVQRGAGIDGSQGDSVPAQPAFFTYISPFKAQWTSADNKWKVSEFKTFRSTMESKDTVEPVLDRFMEGFFAVKGKRSAVRNMLNDLRLGLNAGTLATVKSKAR